MTIFREDWFDPTRPKKEKTAAQREREHQEKVKEAVRYAKRIETLELCCKWFVPIVSTIAAVAVFVSVIATSGTQVSEGIPRAAVIVLEGFKGTVFDELLANNKLPNIQYLAAQGVRAECSSLSDSSCARTQSGQLLGSQYLWTSGPGLASILSGVNADKHQVANDTFTGYSSYSVTSATYPSMLAWAKSSGLSTQVIGASHLITSLATKGGSCSLLGVADFECGTDASGRCLQSSTCNTDIRVTTLPNNDFQGTEENTYYADIAKAFDTTTFDSDLVVLHLNKLARLAEDASYPNCYYSSDSVDYTAVAYVLDSVVGQLVQTITNRVTDQRENWLIILTSDHGGLGKSSGTNTDDDEVIPFVLATLTTSGNLVLNSLQLPTTQMDVAPTVMSWFGVNMTTAVDGKVQSICSTGLNPTDC
mmetsp:Transcript_75334/g.87541  ORF Transcript_75334/g.87541 Transcript_75334/m.87541 type:complete len:420 (+) Transcript_75334:72-1331(+)|eukprot:CAMPEP_0176416068 /NCGR_PEP_ID=MMETSP0127-20121128/6146_1 /TAXON_ID=938130 /ORGANISM="Platyophrya macrostoma, Strain WH" /LENGTH=419 /DNA_ID=CAMNT_0017796113 /DNA_START=66 /DNA_END=1325 /DNA_ORIENTATION=+